MIKKDPVTRVAEKKGVTFQDAKTWVEDFLSILKKTLGIESGQSNKSSGIYPNL